MLETCKICQLVNVLDAVQEETGPNSVSGLTARKVSGLMLLGGPIFRNSKTRPGEPLLETQEVLIIYDTLNSLNFF